MPYETLDLEREEGVAVVALNRPPANAISESLMRELDAVLTEIESDDAVRALIVTGAGDRIFCAARDLLRVLGRQRDRFHPVRQRRACTAA